MNANTLKIRQNSKKDIGRMFVIWEASVKATHHFLSEEDIHKIGYQVKEYLEHVSFLVMTDLSDSVLGFMGMTENKIDSLFVHPDYFGKGIGKFFIAHASSLNSQLFVDVNEDNGQAKIFYEKMGFKTFERSELDDEGRPFPILKMMRSPA